MREIKFRAWIKEHSKMYEIDNKFHICDGESVYKLDPHMEENRFFAMPFIDPVIMQSTGLQDKNGVEIFEGDIVRIYGLRVLFAVKFFDAIASFGLEEIGVDQNRTKITESLCESITVIGNIYEHPHLLEVNRDKQDSVNQFHTEMENQKEVDSEG